MVNHAMNHQMTYSERHGSGYGVKCRARRDQWERRRVAEFPEYTHNTSCQGLKSTDQLCCCHGSTPKFVQPSCKNFRKKTTIGSTVSLITWGGGWFRQKVGPKNLLSKRTHLCGAKLAYVKCIPIVQWDWIEQKEALPKRLHPRDLTAAYIKLSFRGREWKHHKDISNYM